VLGKDERGEIFIGEALRKSKFVANGNDLPVRIELHHKQLVIEQMLGGIKQRVMK
jgi:hypothetical protein